MKPTASTERGQIFPRLVVALVEVMKIDPRRIERIGRSQFDGTRPIQRVCLQHRPRQHVVIALQPCGEWRKYPSKRVGKAIEKISGSGSARSEKRTNASAAPFDA